MLTILLIVVIIVLLGGGGGSSISVDRPVRCDLGRLQQVASNLLANAITHGQADTPVKFTAHADEKHLILEVWNAGEPIPEDSIGKIFQPFWRHSVSTSRTGLGLGLHICSQIVRAHGGQISVTSTASHGTLFTARLPLGTLPKLKQSSMEKLPDAVLSHDRQVISPVNLYVGEWQDRQWASSGAFDEHIKVSGHFIDRNRGNRSNLRRF
jgi:hypothetical protein